MFRRIRRAVQHTLVLLLALLSPTRRQLFRRMVTFSRELPRQFNRPLPEMMAQLTPRPLPPERQRLAETGIRGLADAVAAWHYRSPLGICLRRSLLRYYFLREVDVPVKIIFGARLKNSREGGGVGGHAWLTLHGNPYHEALRDYEGFVEMYHYPGQEQATPASPDILKT